MIWTFAVHQLFLRQKAFAALAVMTGIRRKVNVALIINLLQNVLHHLDVFRVGGADEMIRRNVQQRPGVAEGGGYPVSILTRANALFLRRLDDFLAVLVRARLKAHLIAAQPAETAIGVSNDGGVGVADVRRGIDVINRGGDVGGHGWGIINAQVIVLHTVTGALSCSCINGTYFSYRLICYLVKVL